MDSQVFDVLEKKIDYLINTLKKKQIECEELRKRNLELKTIIEEKDKRVMTLKNELESCQNTQLEVEEFKTKQNHVKNKIETLLEKLKEFEALE